MQFFIKNHPVGESILKVNSENSIKAWNEGRNSLINLIDTRIEKYELIIRKQDSKTQKTIIKEKIINLIYIYKPLFMLKNISQTASRQILPIPGVI